MVKQLVLLIRLRGSRNKVWLEAVILIETRRFAGYGTELKLEWRKQVIRRVEEENFCRFVLCGALDGQRRTGRGAAG